MNIRRLYWVVIPVAFALALSLGHVTAQDHAAGSAYTAAVCSIPTVFEQAVRTRDMLAQLTAISSQLEAEREARRERLRQRQEDLQELQPGSEAYRQEADAIERQLFELRGWQEYQQARMERQHRRMTESMFVTITEVIAQIAEERGIQLVFNATSMNLSENPGQQLMQPYVLHHSATVDITAEVVSRLNEQYTPQQAPLP